jgi:Cu/Ag efflux protein CusF
MLDRVKAGDKVKFEAEKIAGAFTVTKIEPVK